jgi:hypothetical protein
MQAIYHRYADIDGALGRRQAHQARNGVSQPEL